MITWSLKKVLLGAPAACRVKSTLMNRRQMEALVLETRLKKEEAKDRMDKYRARCRQASLLQRMLSGISL